MTRGERIDDDGDEWEGFFSDRYLAPNRGWPDDLKLPTAGDDWYGLAISLWELYTGEDALMHEDMEELLREGRTVDAEAMEDEEVRGFIRDLLIAGGAKT